MKNESSSSLPSNRSFGILFTVVFGLIGAWAFWRHGLSYGWWFGAAAITLLVTLTAPAALTPLNRAWMKLAELLNRVVSPLVLGLLFYAVVTPIGMFKRVTGWDPMRSRFDPESNSYWIDRDPPGPQSGSLKNQF